jgi:LysR family transcriptional regulator, nitrogen assimilation regulatory protein
MMSFRHTGRQETKAMDLRQLRYFSEVALAGNFREAAARLNVSQSSLSRRVLDLERSLTTELFTRHPRGVTLTQTGQVLLNGAERLLREVESIRAEVTGDPDPSAATVTLGTSEVISQMLLAPLAAAFKGPSPMIRLRFVEGQQYLLFEGLDAARIDLAVMTTPEPIPSYKMEVILQEPLYLITRHANRPKQATLGIGDLDRVPLIMFPRPSGIRNYLERQARALGIEIECAYETSNSTAQKEFVMMGLASCILPYSAVADQIGRSGLAATPIAELSLDRTLVWRGDRPQTAAVEKVAQTIRALMVRRKADRTAARQHRLSGKRKTR